MMAWWRVGTLLARGVLHVLVGLFLASAIFPFLPASMLSSVKRWWSRRLLSICRVDLLVVPADAAALHPDLLNDALRPGGIGAMLVLNHVSWLDIFVVYALRPPHFIAKSEIARWPVLGYLVQRAGTVFIERGKRHAVRDINRRVGAMLRDGELIGLFPEGTVTDGTRLLPFHGNLIQSAIDVGAPVVISAIRYRAVDGGPTTATLYTDGINLFQSMIRIARFGPVVAEFQMIDAVTTGATGATGATTRIEVARFARKRIADALGLDDATESLRRTPPGTATDPPAATP